MLPLNPDTRPGDVRSRIAKPWRTVKREMEALHMLGILKCEEETEEVESDEQPGKMTSKTKWLYNISPGLRSRHAAGDERRRQLGSSLPGRRGGART